MKKPMDLIAAAVLVLVFVAETSFAQEPKRLSEAVRRVPAADAAQPTPKPASDSLLNGVLIGAAVGFGAGFATMAAANAAATDSGPIWDGEALGYYTMAGVMGAGVGAGIGALIDALHNDRRSGPQQRPGRVLLTPIYTRGRTGAVLSIRY
jgi:MFS family permease